MDRCNDAYKSDLAWLRAELDSIDPSRAVLVMTRYATSVLEISRPEHLKNPWTSAFATNILSGEKTWVWSVTGSTGIALPEGV